MCSGSGLPLIILRSELKQIETGCIASLPSDRCRTFLLTSPCRLPRGNPLGASRIEIRGHAEVEGCAKNSVGERNRGELSRLERDVGSMRLKFVQEVPQTVQRISD